MTAWTPSDTTPSARQRSSRSSSGRVPDGGGYARRVAVAAEKLHAIPDRPGGDPLDPADAIAMIGTGRMAVYTLDIAAVTAVDVVVVTAAAGGLGTLFVQGALSSGARVIALAGGEAKLRLLRELLPDRLVLVDYTAPDWIDVARTALAGSPATLVLDGVGGDLGTAATALLAGPDGTTGEPTDDPVRGSAGDLGGVGSTGSATARLVAYGWASGAPNRYTSWAGADQIESTIEVRYAVGSDAPPMPDQRPYQERALARAASGQWRVVTHRVPFADAARAHRELEERRTTGKVVLV